MIRHDAEDCPVYFTGLVNFPTLMQIQPCLKSGLNAIRIWSWSWDSVGITFCMFWHDYRGAFNFWPNFVSDGFAAVRKSAVKSRVFLRLLLLFFESGSLFGVAEFFVRFLQWSWSNCSEEKSAWFPACVWWCWSVVFQNLRPERSSAEWTTLVQVEYRPETSMGSVPMPKILRCPDS